MDIQPYLHFGGRCAEALEFYRGAIGLEIEAMMRFKDAPDQGMVPPGSGDKVMHARCKLGDSVLLASDGMKPDAPAMSGFSLSISVPSVEEGRRVFEALKPGGQVTMPFEPTFWTKGFGMLVDRFGVAWMVNVDH